MLECDITNTCDTILDEEVNRIQTIQDDLLNDRYDHLSSAGLRCKYPVTFCL